MGLIVSRGLRFLPFPFNNSGTSTASWVLTGDVGMFFWKLLFPPRAHLLFMLRL
uniref:Candidate secreted effector n=1 Tax=Meloidogyne incognita TaxID=6306 RepID=A0A914LN06_MELIC